MSEVIDLATALESDMQMGQCMATCDDMDQLSQESCVFSETLNEGVQLEMRRSSRSMRSAAFLMISLNKMKSFVSPGSSNISDEQMGDNLFQPLVEGGIVAVHNHTQCSSANYEFHLLGNKECTLYDISQKSLVKPKDAMVLKAITLRGNHNYVKKAVFSMGQYISNLDTPETPPITLSIAGSKWHMSCDMASENAVLQLEEVSCGMERIEGDGEMTRFLFYKRDSGNGMSLTTFESAKYPGWFIRTSSVDSEDVGMCHATSQKMTHFNIHF